jgi:hypothetical protein
MEVQLPLFTDIPGSMPPKACKAETQITEETAETRGLAAPPIREPEPWSETCQVLDPFELLGIDPRLADFSPDASGILSEPAWSAVFITQNLFDHLSFGIGEKSEVYEQQLFDVLCRARFDLELLCQPQRMIPFYYHTESTDLHPVFLIRDDVQPPAAVIGLAEDF